MSTQNALETEVKIAVDHWTLSDATTRFHEIGMQISTPRQFEANYVFDTPQQYIRHAEMLLRLRRLDARTILTWKGASLPGTHKSRPELEVELSSFDTMNQILNHLGYSTWFRYEKYRTEFSSSHGGTATFDETPIGAFLELEGNGPWIDATAVKLGFSQNDYVLESYGKLYLAYCTKLGMSPSNMVFSTKT